MAGLTDMEDLLSEISNKDTTDYMREALACYSNSAYRGCIVMSYLALFEDIRTKLAELAKVNTKAKKVSIEVEKRAKNQEVFESYMADQILSEGLITQAEHQRLNQIRDIRNKAAHPSGVHASAEEARFVYHTVISEYLSKQLLKTTHAVDALIERLDKANLFPTTVIEEVKAIALDEVSGLHKAALPYLFSKLVDACEDSNIQIRKNADRLLVGLAAVQLEKYRSMIKKYLIIDKSHDNDFAKNIGRLIAADPKLLIGLKPEIVIRMKALLLKDTESPATKAITKLSHPANRLGRMIKELGEEQVLAEYHEVLEATLSRFPYNSVLLSNLTDAPQVVKMLLKIWAVNARSSTFDVANAFAIGLSDIDESIDDLITDKDAFELMVGVNEAADWNAHSSKDIRNTHFSSAPNFSAAANRYIAKAPKKASSLVLKKLGQSLDDFMNANFDADDE